MATSSVAGSDIDAGLPPSRRKWWSVAPRIAGRRTTSLKSPLTTSTEKPYSPSSNEAPPQAPEKKSFASRMGLRGKTSPADSVDEAPPWLTLTLKRGWLVSILSVQIILTSGFIALIALSRVRHGIVDIAMDSLSTYSSRSPSNHLFQPSLLWTAVPSLIFTVYNLCWVASVNALLDRQPYVELTAQDGADPHRSILLDYRTSFSFITWARALKNRHHVAGFSALAAVVMGLVGSPFASHVLTPGLIEQPLSIPLRYTNSFNMSRLGYDTDLRAYFDILISTKILNGSATLPWINDEFAFQAFTPSADIPPSTGSWNITAITNAYSGLLDCVIIPINYLNGTTSVSTDTRFYGTDRGCPYDKEVQFPQSTAAFLDSWNVVNCGPEFGYSRLQFFASLASGTGATRALGNSTFISCIPFYSRTPGLVTIAQGPGVVDGQVLAFSNTSGPTSLNHQTLWSLFETVLHEYVTSSPNDAAYKTDFGRLVYDFSQKYYNPIDPLDSNALLQAVPLAFTELFGIILSEVFLQPVVGDTWLDEAQYVQSVNLDGVLSAVRLKLLVYEPLAYTLLVLLAIHIICTGFILFHTKKPSICREEPSGLFSYAAILRGSNIFELVDDVVQHGELERPKKPRWWQKARKPPVHEDALQESSDVEPLAEVLGQSPTSSGIYRGRIRKAAVSQDVFAEGKQRWWMYGNSPAAQRLEGSFQLQFTSERQHPTFSSPSGRGAAQASSSVLQEGPSHPGDPDWHPSLTRPLPQPAQVEQYHAPRDHTALYQEEASSIVPPHATLL